MPIVEYPFLAFSPGSPWRPMLPVEIVNPKTHTAARAYGVVDTGATLCAFPFENADDIGIALEDKHKFRLVSVGDERDAYGYTVTIRVFAILQVIPPGRQTPPDPVIELPDTRIAFVPGLKYPLIGVKGFLDRYAATVNYLRQEFSIRVPSKERGCRICHPPEPADQEGIQIRSV